MELGDVLLEEEELNINAAARAQALAPADLERVLQAEIDDLLQLDAPMGDGQGVAINAANDSDGGNPAAEQYDVLMMDAEGVHEDAELVQPELLMEEPQDVGQALALLGLGADDDDDWEELPVGDEAAALLEGVGAVAADEADAVIHEEEGEDFDDGRADDELERDAAIDFDELEELRRMAEGGPGQYPHPENVPPNQQVAAYRAYLDEPLYAGCEMTLREYANHIIVDLKLGARMSDRCIKRVLRIQRNKLAKKPNLVPPSFHVVSRAG